MRVKSRAMTVASISAVALFATACGGSDDSGDSGGGTGGEIIAKGCEPENPLIGGNTGESCGHDIVELFTSTLFRYDPETSEPIADLAESVETEDNQNFTVKIKEGVKFHDDTEVKAKNFVDAWNYTANSENAQYLAYFFEPIEGYEDVTAEEEGAKPAKSEMSGLEVVDDYTFTIKTSEPVSNLPIRLGYTAFAPQPDSFFEDPEEFAKNPVGAGPYQLTEWSSGQQAVLEKFADYGGGAAKGNLDKITFRIYDDEEAAYNDLLAGNLDTLDNLPASALVDQQYRTDLGDRWAQEEYPAIQTVTFAPADVDPKYDDTKLRQAVSMAIDREKIITDHFDGAREPATGWVAPGVEGFKEGACGEYCEFNPEEAKKLLDEAGGFEGRMTISYNADSDHKPWVTATCNSIREALDVDCVAQPVTTFAQFREQIGDEEMKGMFRSGWIADYPHIENFLTPLYATDGSSNDGNYSNEEFESTLEEAAQAEGDESLALYQEAEAMLAGEDFPAIPMWYYTATIGWSENVSNVKVSQASGRPDLLNATANN